MAGFLLISLACWIALTILLTTSVIFRPCVLSGFYLIFLLTLPMVPLPSIKSMRGYTGIYLKLLIAFSFLFAFSKTIFQIVLFAMPPYGHFLESQFVYFLSKHIGNKIGSTGIAINWKIENSDREHGLQAVMGVNCATLEMILRTVGYVRLNNLTRKTIAVWIAPEILMTIGSVLVFNYCRRCRKLTLGEPVNVEKRGLSPTSGKTKIEAVKFMISFGKFITVVSLGIAAILRPSVQGGLYFLIFLSSCTWWACYKELRRGFAVVLRCLMIVVFLHIIALFAYQIQWLQGFLNPTNMYARYFGLTVLLTVNSSDPRVFLWTDMEWASFVNPLALIWLYFMLAIVSKFLLTTPAIYYTKKKKAAFSYSETSIDSSSSLSDNSGPRLIKSRSKRKKWKFSTPRVRFFSGVSRSKNSESGKNAPTTEPSSSTKYTSFKKSLNSEEALWVKYKTSKKIHTSKASRSKKHKSRVRRTAFKDSAGNETFVEDDIPIEAPGTLENEEEEEEEEEYKLSWLDHVLYAVKSLVQIIIRNTYESTNIIMMAWSIIFHSWITFVLLLWATILWMVPNQRRATLTCSPFLVFYAWFLLISAYIHSMNLTEEELPSNIYNLVPIGFVKIYYLPCQELFIKCLFTSVFWITMRQYMRERHDLEQNRITATGVPTGNRKSRKIMKQMGQFVKSFLARFWIWVVAFTAFVMVLTGERVTWFRIIYMALFLMFVISFQLSFRVWRKMTFSFCVIVILWSTIILILIYTYQFESIREYWSKYLHISETQQLEIGLREVGIKELFILLVIVRFITIIAIIQLYYFHKDFMAVSDPDIVAAEQLSDDSLPQGGIVNNSKKSEVENLLKYDSTNVKTTSSAHFEHTFDKFLKWAHHISNVFFIFLEIHLPNLVLFLTMLLCVYDKCAINLIVLILLVLSFLFGRTVYIFSIYSCSVLASIMILARMIYQMDYFKHEKWDVVCEEARSLEKSPLLPLIINATVGNDAEWLGFKKTDSSLTFLHLVTWNLLIVLAVTIWTAVLVRQYYYRVARGLRTRKAYLMFPKITRADADKNIKSCLQYLANYGFYKFGVEICLIATVTLIIIRMDMYAIFYAMWLLVLYLCKRATLRKIWPYYFLFIVIFLPIQYIMLIGFRPSSCIVLWWDYGETVTRLMYWAYLMESHYTLPNSKLLYDFVVLMLVSKQSLVFRFESLHTNQEFPGGSNESVIHHAEEKDFINPVPDYITYYTSSLDILKRALFLSSMWISLAIVFLAGTNRVNIFSIGYVVGSYIFLWRVVDIYLKPLPKILKSWDYLVDYTMTVILIKTILQLVGCVFVNSLREHACWFVHLFAIGCIEKLRDSQLEFHEPDSCEVSTVHMSLMWDGICFGFLLFQRRIFSSYYFFHVINEAKATVILASRGYEVYEELLQKRLQKQEEGIRTIFKKVKAKMGRIKANQRRNQVASYKQGSHYVAIRSGDYYMFDVLEDDDDLEVIEETPSDIIDQAEERERGPTVGELLSSTLKQGLTTIVGSNKEQIRKYSIRSVIRQRSTLSSISRSVLSTSRSTLRSIPSVDIEGRKHSVVIIDPKETQKSDQADQPIEQQQPSTSKHVEMSDLNEPEEELHHTMINYLLFLKMFIDSVMVSFIYFINKYSKEYRYIKRYLVKEKRELKEKTYYNIGLRLGERQVWHPAASYKTLLKDFRKPENVNKSNEEKPPVSEEDEFDEESRNTSSPSSSNISSSQSNPIQSTDEFEAAREASADQPTIVRLAYAIWHLILNNTANLCYFFIFLKQTESATILALPLPMMVLFWGTLAIPRPSNNFWIAIAVYTQTIAFLKCIFQFQFLPWNETGIESPYYLPRIIGIEAREHYSFWDLIVLVIVLFHRLLLKTLGLWQSTYVPAVVVADGEYKSAQGALQSLEQDPNSISRVSTTTETNNSSSKTSNKSDSEVQNLWVESEGTDVKDAVRSTSWDDKNVQPPRKVASIMTVSELISSFKNFVRQLMDPTGRIASDVYALMFFCDFFNFFVLLIGYSGFDKIHRGEGGIDITENRVPVLFVIMLITQFALIIIDRVIFLRKYIFGKIVFHFSQIIMLHLWLFIVYPVMTERAFNSAYPPQIYYMVKCLYLLLSAYQIRCGYPTRIFGHFLCRDYGYVNMISFKVFMAIPFLYELRNVVDWMWTDTSMTVFEWMKMEDIFARMFVLKCFRYIETEYPQKRGVKKWQFIKYFMGGIFLFLIIGFIWFPFVLFSLRSAVGKSNIPLEVSVKLRIGPYTPIYRMDVLSQSIIQFNKKDKKKMLQAYSKNWAALTFINSYAASDIAAVKFNTESANSWRISPPDRKKLLQAINKVKELHIRFEYIISHKSSSKDKLIKEEVQLISKLYVNGEKNPIRDELYTIVNASNIITDSVELEHLLPKFIKVTNSGTAKAVHQLMDEVDNFKDKMYRALYILRDATSEADWWDVTENCCDFNYNNTLQFLPYAAEKCDSLVIYLFNDKIFPERINFITAGGIIGVYTTIVLVVARLLRRLFEDMCFRIMYEDLPNVDRVLQLCYDIYLVREVREYVLEEDLFAKLLFLFRSPKTLIRWTRRKNDYYAKYNPSDNELVKFKK